MTTLDRERLMLLIEGDDEILRLLDEAGLLSRQEPSYPVEQAELARVAHILVRHLEVNWPGVEIILRMRSEILETRRQIRELLDVLKEARG